MRGMLGNIEWTPRVERLPRDKRGYPVPYIVAGQETGNPSFIVNDQMKVMSCYTQGRCSICGEPMPDDDVWLLGGVRSAFHPAGAYIDPPVHHECGTFALKVCPWLALPNYKKMADKIRVSRMEEAMEEFGYGLVTDPTVDPNKPDCFVMMRVTGYMLGENETRTGYLIHPVRPPEAAERWRDGAQLEVLTSVGIRQQMRDHRKRMKVDEGRVLEDLPEHSQLLWKGKLNNGFPWQHVGEARCA